MIHSVHADVVRETNKFYEKMQRTDSDDEFDPIKVQNEIEKKRSFIQKVESKKEFKKGLEEMRKQLQTAKEGNNK